MIIGAQVYIRAKDELLYAVPENVLPSSRNSSPKQRFRSANGELGSYARQIKCDLSLDTVPPVDPDRLSICNQLIDRVNV